MKFRPILFSTPIVQANLDGLKTQTRRTKGLEKVNDCYFQSLVHHATGRFTFVPNGNFNPTEEEVIEVKCPYGQVGDVLWVRESFNKRIEEFPIHKEVYVYKETMVTYNRPGASWKWKPSIHMPKEACRIFLKIKDIRVESLQDISRGDCMDEGCPFPNIANQTDPKAWYQNLWEKINGKESWYLNPWVWVIEFERIDKPEDFK